MANAFLNNLKANENLTLTENGAWSHKSTLNGVMDLFALGGAYRQRSDADCIALFDKALTENEELAMKCLFYLRDARGGQGERRFFRVIIRWLAFNHPALIRRNLQYIPEYGRYDDWYELVGTPLESQMWRAVRNQLTLDVNCKTPSLLAKWLKSENTSSEKSRELGAKTRKALGMTARQYRKTLSVLRERIRVVERLMSANRWEEIEFDKIPSKAGLIYRNAFARRDILKEKYEQFAKSVDTKVNAKTLYPYEICNRANSVYHMPLDAPERVMLQKYWDNLPNYYGDNEENGLAIIDTSGSMTWGGNGVIPIDAAISMGAYIADKAHGPFAHHFITFSPYPKLVEFYGADITEKYMNVRKNSIIANTNLKAVFDLLLKTAMESRAAEKEMPTRLYIFSDMEFDGCVNTRIRNSYDFIRTSREDIETLMEATKREWAQYGYKLPDVVFWNLNSRERDNIPAIGPGFSYVSGFSPVIMETILSGKTGWDLVLEKLTSQRYEPIH